MKICFIIEAWKPFYAGGQVHAIELCNRLVKDYNYNIDIYTRKLIVNNKKYTKNESLYNGKLKIKRLGIATKYESFIGRISWIISILIKNLKKRYNIIHGQANLGGLPTKLIGMITKTPTVFTVHGSGLLVSKELWRGPTSKINKFIEKFLQTGIKYNKEISVDTRFCKFKNRNKPIVIPNGVDIKKFDKINVKKEKNFFKILFVGRLHPQKGLKYLIEATNIIKNKLKNVKIYIIGSGETEKELKEMTKNLKIDNIIKFRGKILGEKLIKEYKSSHLFVLPSIFEGQPLTLLEAWAAKLPVLVTNVGDNDKFLVNGKNGWIIPYKNSKILADKLLKIIKIDKNKLENIGKEGYNLVKEKYSWNTMVEKTVKVYKSLK